MLECRGCHLADGTGSPGAVPALAGQVARYLAVPGGREYLLRVPGVAQSGLSDAELAELLNWVVAYFGPESFATGAAAFDAREVARHRATPLDDVAAARARLQRALRELPPQPEVRAR